MSRPVLPNTSEQRLRDLENRLRKLERRPGGGGGGGGSGLPNGGVAEDILVKHSSTNGDALWASIVESGFSARYSASVDINGVQDLFDYIFNITYTAPAVTTPTTSLGVTTFELPTLATDYTVSCVTTKFSNNITSVQFQISTDGGSTWTNIGGSTPAHSGGGTETTGTQTADLTATTKFRVQVGDGTSTTTSGIFTITAQDNPPVIATFTSSVSTSTNREKTVDVLSPQFNVTVTKHTHSITGVVLKRGATTVHTYSGLGSGGTDNSVTDTNNLTDNVTYTLNVDDGVNSTVIASIVYNKFHYPVFYGVGAAALDAAGIIANLTKDLSMASFASQSRSYTNGSGDDRMYLVVPGTGVSGWSTVYAHAIDPATNFDYFPLFNTRTVTIDGVTYTVYEYSIDLTASTFTLNWT